MLVDFFYKLRSARLPVSLTEYLSLLEAMRQHVASNSVDDFYFLSRAALVKDERHYDRFDQVFGAYFKGMEELFDEVVGEIPEEWLRKQAERELAPPRCTFPAFCARRRDLVKETNTESSRKCEDCIPTPARAGSTGRSFSQRRGPPRGDVFSAAGVSGRRTRQHYTPAPPSRLACEWRAQRRITTHMSSLL